jgi:predicted amidohydrolase YtcJ
VKLRIITAQRLHTFSPLTNRGNALLEQGGRVLEVAPVQHLRDRYPAVEVIDFGAATITPGLADAHIHVTEWAIARTQVQLSDAGSITDCLQMIAHAPRATSWVQGRGWNPHRWGGGYPERRQLDSVTDRPAALQSHDMHALWVNSAALQAAGIDAGTPDPAGGRIVRDEAGEPTGMLLETAAQLVVTRIPQVSADQMHSAVLAAQGELHGYGITSVHSYPGFHLPEPDPLSVLQGLQAAGALRLRVLQHIAVNKLTAAISSGLRSGSGDEWIRIGGVKMFLDGALGSRTAWMRAAYEGSDNVGVQVLPRAEFEQTVGTAAQAGIATVVHAIGDAAVAVAFEVLSQAPRVPALPHRIEHVQCFPLDRADLLSSGIICSVQPCHLMTDWRAADQHWGARGATTYAFRTLLDGGAILACGSDAPVESADPRLGLYAAVARKDTRHQPDNGWYGEQCISTREVLAGYTTGAAAAAGAVGQQGVLQPGSFADCAVWQHDPLACEPRELLELRTIATLVGGEVVFQA